MSRKEWTFLQYFTWKSMTSQKLCTFSFLARFLLIFKNSVQIWIIFHIFLLSCYMFFLFLTFLTQHAILGVTSPENNISLFLNQVCDFNNPFFWGIVVLVSWTMSRRVIFFHKLVQLDDAVVMVGILFLYAWKVRLSQWKARFWHLHICQMDICGCCLCRAIIKVLESWPFR